MKYTYLVDHGDKTPTVSANMKIEGDTVVAVQFGDAFKELDRMRIALEAIRDNTRFNNGVTAGAIAQECLEALDAAWLA